jgi:hypothetical protein
VWKLESLQHRVRGVHWKVSPLQQTVKALLEDGIFPSLGFAVLRLEGWSQTAKLTETKNESRRGINRNKV